VLLVGDVGLVQVDLGWVGGVADVIAALDVQSTLGLLVVKSLLYDFGPGRGIFDLGWVV
jgi:hypothetical protein